MTDIAIIDYGLGNLFSVKQACKYAGLDSKITRENPEIRDAKAVILPGVGAFGRAMDALHDLNLVDVIKDTADAGKPVIGICLGAQLLMSESREFGRHHGLDLISGDVRRLDDVIEVGEQKVPHVGWERVAQEGYADIAIDGTNLLSGVENQEYLYFVHSFCIEADAENVAAVTKYGEGQFCSAVISDNVAGFQFHPERSGPAGLQIYENIYQMLNGGGHNA